MKIKQVILCESSKQTQSLTHNTNDNSVVIVKPISHMVNKSTIKEIKVGKVCSCCGEMKLYTSYFKRKNGSKDGYRAQCKICYKLKD